MKVAVVRRLAAAILTMPLLLLAACGDDGGSDDEEASESESPEVEPVDPAEDDPLLDAVSVSGDVGEKPTVEFEAPLEVEGVFRRTIVEGEGEPIEDGGEVAVHINVFDAIEGTELEDSYSSLAETVVFDQAMLSPGMAASLMDIPIGSRVLAAADAESLYGAPAEELETQGIDPNGAFVFVLDVLEPGMGRAEGSEVEPVEGLPTVTLDDEGAPTIEVPDEDPPTELVSQLLIEGEGEEVPEGGTVRVHYTGVLWDDGSVFDSSWETGTPATFGLDQVVDGWGQGLAGVPVGSQVLLVIPPELGYGAEGTGDGSIPGDATLVFVVDVLEAAPPAPAAEDPA